MFNRRVVLVLLILLIGVLCAEDRVQSELRFAAHSKDEKTAGVWVDSQYVGFVKELAGDKKLVLLPGKHEIVIRQAWYNEFVRQVILEPGQTQQINVALVKSVRLPTKDATGELKIAAIFAETEEAVGEPAGWSESLVHARNDYQRAVTDRRIT